MKLNKPVITSIVIILLVINLVFFSFVNISKKMVNKETLTSIVEKFNLYKYVIESEEIKSSIKEYRYPKEAFNYIDDSSVIIIKNKIVLNLLNEEKEIVSKDDIKYVLNNSVYQYEVKTHSDIAIFVENDIESISNKITEFFSQDSVNYIRLFKFFSNSLFELFSIILSIILVVLIILYEKKNGYLFCSIVFICYSFTLYYLDSYFIKNMLLGIDFSSYFNKVDTLTISLESIYIICFILSFVLLLIYIAKTFKKVVREIRLKSYENWR